MLPRAETGRWRKLLTRFGAEWCCCLVPLPCCCLVPLPLLFLLLQIRSFSRGSFSCVQVPRDLSGGLPERISGATLGVLDSIAEEFYENPKRVGEIPRRKCQFWLLPLVVFTTTFSFHLSFSAEASGCFRRRWWLRTVPRRYVGRLAKSGEGLAF